MSPIHSKSPDCRRRAFTLIEMAIVMLVMGILAGASAPRFAAALSRARVDAAAKRVVADLRLARSSAKHNSAERSVTFLVNDDRYTIADVAHLNRRGNLYEVDFSREDCPCTITLADFSSSHIATFDWRGQPAAPGTVVVGAGAYSRTIEVNAAGIVELIP